ncbi:MAG TPA: response regulator [Acetobacteraceae bacterium]|nr:response regulator [Acetobacteraceae bacterium]
MASFPREELMAALPYARRYARALTGSQQAGDSLVAEALGTLQATEDNARLGLYAAISRLADQTAQRHPLDARERQMLLLTTLEDLPADTAGRILGLDAADAHRALESARAHVKSMASAEILIIEDEPIIAMDLELLVKRCGHRVVGIAGSETQAVNMAMAKRPSLILADINLGRGGDGSRAVDRILKATEDSRIPVIFVTAYPERLLTGQAVEPALVITKPFDPMALAVATFEAVSRGVPVP